MYRFVVVQTVISFNFFSQIEPARLQLTPCDVNTNAKKSHTITITTTIPVEKRVKKLDIVFDLPQGIMMVDNGCTVTVKEKITNVRLIATCTTISREIKQYIYPQVTSADSSNQIWVAARLPAIWVSFHIDTVARYDFFLCTCFAVYRMYC